MLQVDGCAVDNGGQIKFLSYSDSFFGYCMIFLKFLFLTLPFDDFILYFNR